MTRHDAIITGVIMGENRCVNGESVGIKFKEGENRRTPRKICPQLRFVHYELHMDVTQIQDPNSGGQMI